jgi:hypothetical protein
LKEAPEVDRINTTPGPGARQRRASSAGLLAAAFTFGGAGQLRYSQARMPLDGSQPTPLVTVVPPPWTSPSMVVESRMTVSRDSLSLALLVSFSFFIVNSWKHVDKERGPLPDTMGIARVPPASHGIGDEGHAPAAAAAWAMQNVIDEHTA